MTPLKKVLWRERNSIPQIVCATAHRPWPLPRAPWIMTQTWRNLLFAHWPIAAERLRPLAPPILDLDLHDGAAYVAVTPFLITNLRARFLPPIPSTSHFPELNVRTYVRYQDKPGVFFFSLDAGNRAAVLAARTAYHLPYYHAQMKITGVHGGFEYSSKRLKSPSSEFEGSYRAVSAARTAQFGTLEHWLTERYCLYAVDRGRLYRADIHHLPWPLQDAAAEIKANTMAQSAGVELPGAPPLLHFARELKVLVWWPERLS